MFRLLACRLASPVSIRSACWRAAASCAIGRWSNCGDSPHLATIRLGSNHRVAGLATERLAEGRQVRQRPVDAEFRDRVRIALDHRALRLRPGLVTAPLAPGQEELLFRREAVERRLGTLALARLLVGEPGALGAGE